MTCESPNLCDETIAVVVATDDPPVPNTDCNMPNMACVQVVPNLSPANDCYPNVQTPNCPESPALPSVCAGPNNQETCYPNGLVTTANTGMSSVAVQMQLPATGATAQTMPALYGGTACLFVGVVLNALARRRQMV